MRHMHCGSKILHPEVCSSWYHRIRNKVIWYHWRHPCI